MVDKKQNYEASVYLVGAMEAAKGLGKGWRDELKPFFEERKVKVYSPNDFEPYQLKGLHVNRLPEEFESRFTQKKIKPRTWHALKVSASKLFTRFMKYMTSIIFYDCDVVLHEADFLLCKWDESTFFGCGTQGEITLAKKFGIPVFIINNIDDSFTTSRGTGKDLIPAWAVGCAEEVFSSVEEFKEFFDDEYELIIRQAKETKFTVRMALKKALKLNEKRVKE